MKLETIIEQQREHTALMQRLLINTSTSIDHTMIEDVLPSRLEELYCRVATDKNYKEQMVM
jgi:hypothetical protein